MLTANKQDDGPDLEPVESILNRLRARFSGIVFVGVQDLSPKPPCVAYIIDYDDDGMGDLLKAAVDELEVIAKDECGESQ